LTIFPPPEEQRLAVLNEVWKIVAKDTQVPLLNFVKCTASWLELLQKHYSEREIMVLLSTLSTRLQSFTGVEIPDLALVSLEYLIVSLVAHTAPLARTTVVTYCYLLFYYLPALF
jgi:hypothetical protein